MVDLAEVQEFFFNAMLKGYVSGTKPISLATGSKEFVFSDGEYVLADRYVVNPGSSKSAGTTTIWHNGIPIWFMSYCGWYEEEAIVTLKTALAESYRQQDFRGGRGPIEFQNQEHRYFNTVEAGAFDYFVGHEYIYRSDDHQRMGFHNYFGMSLI